MLDNSYVRKILALMVKLYVKIVLLTSSIKRHVPEESLPYITGKSNCIMACWHGNMLIHPAFRPLNRPVHVLISEHRDGRIISEFASLFGMLTIDGSSSRGGANAMRAMFKAIAAGENIAITPDGPRGPKHIAEIGIAQIAQKTKTPVIPLHISASKCKYLSSWDNFSIPLPFSKIDYFVGPPIIAEDGEDTERLRKRIEDSINALL